jgi:hypothetical protein
LKGISKAVTALALTQKARRADVFMIELNWQGIDTERTTSDMEVICVVAVEGPCLSVFLSCTF